MALLNFIGQVSSSLPFKLLITNKLLSGRKAHTIIRFTEFRQSVAFKKKNHFKNKSSFLSKIDIMRTVTNHNDFVYIFLLSGRSQAGTIPRRLRKTHCQKYVVTRRFRTPEVPY